MECLAFADFFSVSILHLKDLYRFYQTKLFLVVKKGYYCKVSYLNEWIHKQKIVKTGSKRFFYIVSLGCNISRPHIIRAYYTTALPTVLLHLNKYLDSVNCKVCLPKYASFLSPWKGCMEGSKKYIW